MSDGMLSLNAPCAEDSRERELLRRKPSGDVPLGIMSCESERAGRGEPCLSTALAKKLPSCTVHSLLPWFCREAAARRQVDGDDRLQAVGSGASVLQIQFGAPGEAPASAGASGGSLSRCSVSKAGAARHELPP